MTQAVQVRCSAKINLELAVGPVRPDGFHDVATIYHAVSLYDEVVATVDDGLSVAVSGKPGLDVSAVPGDERNLAAVAAITLAGRLGRDPDVHLHITKGIPVAGGMAGGSADAAAALVACDALWGARLPREELLEIAASLGSDVPFGLIGGTAMGAGRGERVTPMLTQGRFHWVIAVADGGLSTPEVYRECDRLRADTAVPPPQVGDALIAALRAGDADGLGVALRNDLQPAALSLRPQLGETLESGLAAGALGALVSGSGPTAVFLARGPEHAIDIAVALSATGTCSAVRRAWGPVAGAQVRGRA